MSDRLFLSGDGMFYTLQGEGTSIGVPIVFVRLQGCNLRCSWCDTPYSWNPEDECYDENFSLSFKEIREKILELWSSNDSPRVAFTGGEPLLQQKWIVNFIEQNPDWFYEFETNGTIVPREEIRKWQFNCSPKLENSGNSREARIKPAAINVLKDLNTNFKFVVQTPEDVEELERDYVIPFSISNKQVILMPEGVTVKANRKHVGNVLEIAKQKNYRVLTRLQIQLFGNTRRT